MMKSKHISQYLVLIALIVIIFAASCKKYLDAKPNINLEIPSTLEDLQALLDDVLYMNEYGSSILELASDDHYVSTSVFNATDVNTRMNYIWDPSAMIENNWDEPYDGPVYNSNIVLDNLKNVPNTSTTDYNRIMGSALFLRAFGFYDLSQLYTPPFDKNGANQAPGICLRLTASVTQPSVRTTVKETYDQIIKDLKQSASLLPATSSFNTRPNKTSAYAMLARVYLEMQDYQNAYNYANSSLNLYSTLIDYNSIDSTVTYPFPGMPTLNREMTFFFQAQNTHFENPKYASVDSNLYKSYANNDLRKSVFFKKVKGLNGFYGSYTANSGFGTFYGLATDETYLIRAECSARLGNTTAAMSDLNTILSKRWKAGTFVNFTAVDGTDALNQILTERRKELLYRGLRWSDLRRLNLDPKYAITLKRVVNGQTYTLPPNDLRYTMLIPAKVITLSGIAQNPR